MRAQRAGGGGGGGRGLGGGGMRLGREIKAKRDGELSGYERVEFAEAALSRRTPVAEGEIRREREREREALPLVPGPNYARDRGNRPIFSTRGKFVQRNGG